MGKEVDLLQRLVESCDAIVYLKDEDGRFLFVNRAFEETFQLGREEALGKDDFSIGSKEQAEAWRGLDAKVRQTGTAVSVKSTIAVPAGRLTTVDHKFPVSGIDGVPGAVGGIAIKLTGEE